MIAIDANDLARAAGLKRVYAQRVIGEIKTGKRTMWRSHFPKLCADDPAKIVLSTLPLAIREAVVMFDQMDLPLPPPCPN